MARIDSLIAALFSHKGDELYFRTGTGITVRVGDQSRQVMHKPLTQQQVDAVMREIMPPTQPLPPLEGGAAIFQYRAPAGEVQVTFERFKTHSVVSVTPALAAPVPEPEVKAPAPPAVAATIQEYGLQQLLTLALEQGATDIHLRPGLSPVFRLGGELVLLRTHPAIDAGFIERELLVHAPHGAKAAYEAQHEFEFRYVFGDRAGVRITLLHDRLNLVAVLRFQPLKVAPVETLGFWEHARDLFDQQRGLILVGGASGSGKSTTLASVVDYYGRTRPLHSLVIEKSLEYPLVATKGFVTQRQVGVHVQTQLDALHQALHSDVDVVAVPLLDTPEEWNAALALAEAGKLVLAGVQAATASLAILNVLGRFPPFEQPTVSARLARVFAGATSQQLVPKRPNGRLAAMETLTSVPAVREAIRKGRSEELVDLQQATRDAGSVTMDDALASLVAAGKVDDDQALRFVTTPARFFSRLQPLEAPKQATGST